MTVNDGDILRVAARMNVQGKGDIVNVFHYRADLTGPQTDGDVLDAVADYLDHNYDLIDTYIPNDQTFEDINVFNLTQGVPIGLTAWPILTAGGDVLADSLPGQMSALVRFTTGYSRNWSRKFLGQFTEAQNTATGNVNSTLLTALAGFAADVLTPWVFATTEQLTNVVYNKALAAYVDLQEAVVRNIWSTVRTRRENRGS